MPHPSATLTVWATAWLHGVAAPDDVIDALHTWAELHEVAAVDDDAALALDLPGPDDRPTSVVGLLAAARRAEAMTGRVLLPVPGDVRGLPATPAVSRAALDAGEVALLHGAGTALAAVPTAVADGVLRWTVHAVTELPPAEEAALPDAEHGLRGAVRQAATTLIELGVAKHRPGVREEIAETLGTRVRPNWPDGTPGRVLRVLEQADEVEAIVLAAARDSPGAALSARAAQGRATALAPLSLAVREARRSAVAEAVRVLTQPADRH